MKYSQQKTLKLYKQLDLDSPRTGRIARKLGYFNELIRLRKPNEMIADANEEMFINLRYDFYLRNVFKMIVAVQDQRKKAQHRLSKETRRTTLETLFGPRVGMMQMPETKDQRMTKEYIANRIRAMRSERQDSQEQSMKKLKRIFDATLKTQCEKIKLKKKAQERVHKQKERMTSQMESTAIKSGQFQSSSLLTFSMYSNSGLSSRISKPMPFLNKSKDQKESKMQELTQSHSKFIKLTTQKPKNNVLRSSSQRKYNAKYKIKLKEQKEVQFSERSLQILNQKLQKAKETHNQLLLNRVNSIKRAQQKQQIKNSTLRQIISRQNQQKICNLTNRVVEKMMKHRTRHASNLKEPTQNNIMVNNSQAHDMMNNSMYRFQKLNDQKQNNHSVVEQKQTNSKLKQILYERQQRFILNQQRQRLIKIQITRNQQCQLAKTQTKINRIDFRRRQKNKQLQKIKLQKQIRHQLAILNNVSCREKRTDIMRMTQREIDRMYQTDKQIYQKIMTDPCMATSKTPDNGPEKTQVFFGRL